MQEKKLQKQLKILQSTFLGREEECEKVFGEYKRSFRKSLAHLLRPDGSAQDYLDELKTVRDKDLAKKVLQQWLHCFFPNASATALYAKWKKEKDRKSKPGKDTLTLTKKYRVAPQPEEWQQMFTLMGQQDGELVAYFLQEIRPFAYLLSPYWSKIDAWVHVDDITVAKAALQLLGKMPDGINKSIMTFALCIANEKLTITALAAMQHADNLPPSLIMPILQPTIDEYKRLMRSEGRINERWQEFRLIQTIYRNNGIRLSIPEIDLRNF